MNMKEEKVLHEAINKFEELTYVRLQTIAKEKRLPNGNKVDLILKMIAGKESIKFFVKVKSELRQLNMLDVLDRVEKDHKEDWLLISQYIPKPLKEELRKQGLNYLEASGNCFIRHGGLFFYINDQQVTSVRLPEKGKLWKAAGLKFLFVLLQHPHILNEPYRVIAKASNIALGNVGPFIDELKNEGYVKEKANGEMFLEGLDHLTRRWIELYPTVLREKLKMGQFLFLDENQFYAWEQLPTKNFYWGGEAAGALLTNYLKPEKLTIYTSEPKAKLMKELKLVPDEKGNVELLEAFWNEEQMQFSNKLRTVPPFLVYAELVTSLDSRNRETAEKIREVYFKHER